MKKLFIGLFAALLATGIIGCSNASSSDSSTTSTYTVTINASENGTVTASKTSAIAAGETITLTVTPADPDDGDCTFVSLSVKNGDTDITVTNNTFTMPAANVTVSATFTKKTYIGSKKPSRAKAVGDIVFNDGSAMPYTTYTTLDTSTKDAKKTSAIALIFYKGTGLNSDVNGVANTTTSRTLGVGLKHNKSGLAWCTNTANAYDIIISTIQCPANRNNNVFTFTGNKNGSNNLELIEAFEGVNDTTGEDAANRYPAFYFGKNYKNEIIENETESRIPANSEFATGWYLPSIAELYQIWVCRADTSNGFDIDSASNTLGGNQLETSSYWSSSQVDDSNVYRVYGLNFNNGICSNEYKHINSGYACCIREFN